MGQFFSSTPPYQSLSTSDGAEDVELGSPVAENLINAQSLHPDVAAQKAINEKKKALLGLGPGNNFVDRPLPKLSSVKNATRSIKMVLPYFWPAGEPILRLRVVICVFLLIASKFINLGAPFAMGRIVDNLQNLKSATHWVLFYAAMRFLSSNLGDMRDAIFINVENHATKCVALDTFQHCQKLSLSFHLMRNTGAVLRTLERGKSATTTLVEMLGFTLVPTLFEVLLTCAVLFTSYGGWEYSLVTFLTISAYITFTLVVTEWRTRFRREMNEKDNESNNSALDSLINFETVKYCTAERHETKRYAKSLNAYYDASVKNQISLTLLNTGQGLIITSGLCLAMYLSAREVVKGKMTVGELVAVNTFIIQLYSPLSWLGGVYRMILTAFTDLEKLFELLAEPLDVADLPNAEPLMLRRGDVEFDNVTFFYPSRGDQSADSAKKEKEARLLRSETNSQNGNGIRAPGDPTLKKVSFVIPGGKTCAVVGPSGSGKTTLSRLLCRFYDPHEGAVRIDGQDIRSVTQRSLRRRIGVVPQDTVLFNDTIGYNIAYGGVGVENSISLEDAAKGANIYDFIMSTPNGFETRVGERGLRLSGGEKQRVAIARTILKDPSILILDEATSALDSKTEKEIQASLMEVSKGRTTLIIAHRLSTVVEADEIIVLKNGEIVERGTHRELLDRRGEYSAMWELQVKEQKKLIGAPSDSPIIDLLNFAKK